MEDLTHCYFFYLTLHSEMINDFYWGHFKMPL